MFALVILFVVSLIAPSLGQVTGALGCPNVNANPYVDFRKYQGTWYEIERYMTSPILTDKCSFAHYQNYHKTEEYSGALDAVVGLTHRLTGRKIVTKWHGKAESYDGKSLISLAAESPYRFGKAKLRINLPFFVLDTDYHNYSVEWYCSESSPIDELIHTQTLRIMSRKSYGIPDAIRKHIYAQLKSLNINLKKMVKIDQRNCPRN